MKTYKFFLFSLMVAFILAACGRMNLSINTYETKIKADATTDKSVYINDIVLNHYLFFDVMISNHKLWSQAGNAWSIVTKEDIQELDSSFKENIKASGLFKTFVNDPEIADLKLELQLVYWNNCQMEMSKSGMIYSAFNSIIRIKNKENETLWQKEYFIDTKTPFWNRKRTQKLFYQELFNDMQLLDYSREDMEEFDHEPIVNLLKAVSKGGKKTSVQESLLGFDGKEDKEKSYYNNIEYFNFEDGKLKNVLVILPGNKQASLSLFEFNEDEKPFRMTLGAVEVTLNDIRKESYDQLLSYFENGNYMVHADPVTVEQYFKNAMHNYNGSVFMEFERLK